jgi:hypothetical protein
MLPAWNSATAFFGVFFLIKVGIASKLGAPLPKSNASKFSGNNLHKIRGIAICASIIFLTPEPF